MSRTLKLISHEETILFGSSFRCNAHRIPGLLRRRLPRFEQISGGDTAWLEGREYLYARDFSESTNCTTYILIPTDYIYHDSILMLNESALVLCLVLVLTVLFAVLVSRWVSGPILRLAEQVRGYTRDHTPIAMEYRRQDEVGRLASDVREMSLRIDAMVQQVYDTERAKRKLQFQALQAQINQIGRAHV